MDCTDNIATDARMIFACGGVFIATDARIILPRMHELFLPAVECLLPRMQELFLPAAGMRIATNLMVNFARG
jgi:hypothetical protein